MKEGPPPLIPQNKRMRTTMPLLPVDPTTVGKLSDLTLRAKP